MKAFILAAGLGSRLGSITVTTPKCLVPVGGATMLEHVAQRLVAAGVTEVVINLFHLGAQVEQFVVTHDLGLKVHFSREVELLGTGGGVKAAAQHFLGEESFFIYNADILSNLDLRELWSAHQKSGALATLAVMDRPSSRCLSFTTDGTFLGSENSDGTNQNLVRQEPQRIRLAFSGIHVARPELFTYLAPERGNFSILNGYRRAAAAGKRIQAFRMDHAQWFDVGSPEKLKAARAAYEQSKT